MRGFGIFLAFVGAIYLIFAFNMDVSVQTSSTFVPGYGSIGGGEVANLELMSRRQNHLIVAALITLVGVLLIIFGTILSRNETANVVNTEVESFNGDRDITSDAYRLWLARAYSIERNDVFDSYVIINQTFKSLDDALAHAHSLEQGKLIQAMEEQKKREDDQAQAREAARINAEIAEAEWKKRKPKYIVGSIIFLGLLLIFFIPIWKKSVEQEQIRLAKEAAEKARIISDAESKFGVSLPEDVYGIRVREKAGNYQFACEWDENALLLEFNTKYNQYDLKEKFSKELGKGDPLYKHIDKADWVWDKNNKKYILKSFHEKEYYLCLSSK